MSNQLHINNPEQLSYANDYLKVTVLGGIKIEGLDRMRTTLKVQLLAPGNLDADTAQLSSVPPVRHNLDLYNDTQLEKFIRKTATKLEIGTSLIAATLAELTEQLEQYRLKRLDEQTPEHYKPKPLTPQEQEAAETFLTSPKLLEETNRLIGQSGVIGEEQNRLLMYLIFTSRKTEKPLHIVSLGASGTGKTHLQEKVGELIPEEDTIEITTLSANAFYYFGQRELKNKLILIEDLDGADTVLYPLRELQSKKKISKTIAHKNTKGETRTVHLVVEGPVSVAGCTTKESIYEDNANRSFLIYLDESKEQDQRIMDYQRAISARKINTQQEEKARTLLQNCQRILEPVTVVNPFAEHLVLPREVFKPRRTNNHYLQFIEAVTFYHQKQREQKHNKDTGEIYIETTLEDIKIANTLLAETLLRKSDNLTGACRNYFERLKLYLVGEKESRFTNRSVSLALRVSLATVKRHHLQLYNAGYLKYEKDKKTKTYYYEIISYKEYKDLQTSVNTVLDNVLKNLLDGGRLNGSIPAQPQNEPPNKQKTNKQTPPAQANPKIDVRTKKNSVTSTVAERPLTTTNAEGTTSKKSLKKLNPAAIETIEFLNNHPNLKKAFTNEQLSRANNKKQKTNRMHIKTLVDAGILIKQRTGKTFTYTLQS